MDIQVYPDNRLTFADLSFECALGQTGVRRDKREGDKATPVGRFPLRRVLFRADRMARPKTALPTTEIRPNDGWCDDPTDPRYNQAVERPCAASHETLWREDSVYDIVVVLGHNDAPPIPGAGSAIFLHVARTGFAPTEGCVALRREDLLTLLGRCGPDDRLIVHAEAAG